MPADALIQMPDLLLHRCFAKQLPPQKCCHVVIQFFTVYLFEVTAVASVCCTAVRMKMVFAVPLSSAHLLTAFSTPNHARAEVEVFCTQFSYGRSRFSSFRSLLKGFLRDDRKTAIGDSYNFFFRLMAMTVSPMIVILCRRTIVNIGPGVFGIVQYLIKGCTIWSKWIAFFRNVSGSIETFCNVTIAVWDCSVSHKRLHDLE